MKKFLTTAALLSASALYAHVKVATVFSDNMVLQRDAVVPVWGSADAGEKVTVTFAGQKVSAVAGKNGKWLVRLAPMKECRENRAMTVSGKTNTVTIKNCLVGEVWLCSGQSNMAMAMWSNDPRLRAANGDKDAKAGANPLIRIATVAPAWAPYPRTDTKVDWKVLDEKNGINFSAVAFYFGQDIFRNLDVPVGLLVSAWPGSEIEPFIPASGFNSVTILRPNANIVNIVTPGTEEFIAAHKFFSQAYANWLKEFNAAYQNNRPAPPPPDYPSWMRPPANRFAATTIYNAMIHPLTPFRFRGVLLYQGSSNIHDGLLYQHKLQALLNGWRKAFRQPEMPFYIVQLAPWDYSKFSRPPYALPTFWEAQNNFIKANKNVGMAVINDAGDIGNIHPAQKYPVGHRLALLALRHTYGKDVKADSPELSSWKIEGNKFILSFKNVEKWQGTPDHFEIAGKDGKWSKADVEISGTDMIVSAPQISAPVQMRYLWLDTLSGVLFNEAGLPLSGFRCGNYVTKLEIVDQIVGSMPLVFQYNMKNVINPGGVPGYLINNSPSFKKHRIKRIAYVIELIKPNGDENWAVILMDPFTQQSEKLGIPTQRSGIKFGVNVKNLQVFSNVPGVATGNIPEGRIEFWGCDYLPGNASNVPGADPGIYDFGDMMSRPEHYGYGSMQIHNLKDKQVVFAYNNFHSAENDIGIGNAPGKHTDWTHSKSGKLYSKAILRIFADFE